MKQGFRKNRRDGMIFGVCRGIADHYGFSVFWTRFLAVCACIFTGFWPAVGLYIVAALVMKISSRFKSIEFRNRSRFAPD